MVVVFREMKRWAPRDGVLLATHGASGGCRVHRPRALNACGWRCRLSATVRWGGVQRGKKREGTHLEHMSVMRASLTLSEPNVPRRPSRPSIHLLFPVCYAIGSTYASAGQSVLEGRVGQRSVP